MPREKIQKEKRYCKECGKSFMVLPRKPNKFCSQKCSYAGRAKASPEWKSLGRNDQNPVNGGAGTLEEMYLSAAINKSIIKREPYREAWL